MAFVKRILVGRPLATTEMEHQRIPKTIALAVFSSDAISSTAYATEEILFVVAVGGIEPRARPRHARPDRDRRRASCWRSSSRRYRQTIFAYPSGGGCYVVSRENLGENPSLVAGASLLVDYILTVAVSISAGVAAIVSIPRSTSSASTACCSASCCIALISVANLRGIKESGRSSPVPDLRLHRQPRRARRLRPATASFIGTTSRPIPVDAEASHERQRRPAARSGCFILLQGLLVGRGRAHRRRGDLERRARVPQPESKNAADDARRGWASILGTLLHRRLGAGPPPQPVSERERRRCCRSWARRCSASGTVHVLRAAVRDRRDPDPGRQHRVRRLPAAVVDHRPRRLPAAPARQPRRPARVLQRHPRARGRGRRC